ncbi:MAG: ABC transporter substrate-binding protein, partial [Nitrospinota bacterium]
MVRKSGGRKGRVLLWCILLLLVVLSPQPSPAQRRGGTLVFGRGGDSVGLDPALQTDGNSFMVTDNLYDQLVHFREKSTELAPGLAERWEVSEDGLRYTFHLRRGVRFHDGSPFDADAVVFSLGRQMARPKLRWHGKPLSLPRPAGAYQYWASMAMDEIVDRVEALGRHRVRITLKRREAPFLANLAMQFASIVSPRAALRWGEDFSQHPVGTGPFRFVRWVKDDLIELRRNPTFWGGAPPLARVIFRAIPDNTARLLELEAGSVDILQHPNPEDLPRLARDPRFRLVRQAGMNVAYLGFNTERDPFRDRRVRRAIAHAIQKRALVEALYLGLGRAAVNPLPPMVWGYHKGIRGYPHDPKRARELLREAGFPGGFETTLWTMTVPRPYMPKPLRVAEAIQADLRKVGVRARIVTFEWGTYLHKTRQGEHDMFLLGWTGDNGDPDNFLFILLDGLADPFVRVRWKHPEFHSLMVRAK